MSIRVRSVIIAIDSVTNQPIYPKALGLTEEIIKKYMKQVPMPPDPYYSAEDLIRDLTRTDGILILPFSCSSTTLHYVERLLNDLIERVADRGR